MAQSNILKYWRYILQHNIAQSNILKSWKKISPMRASRRREDGGSSGWPLRGLDHCRFVRLAPHNTANQPEALNTVASVVIPSYKLGLVNWTIAPRRASSYIGNETNVLHNSHSVAFRNFRKWGRCAIKLGWTAHWRLLWSAFFPSSFSRVEAVHHCHPVACVSIEPFFKLPTRSTCVWNLLGFLISLCTASPFKFYSSPPKNAWPFCDRCHQMYQSHYYQWGCVALKVLVF